MSSLVEADDKPGKGKGKGKSPEQIARWQSGLIDGLDHEALAPNNVKSQDFTVQVVDGRPLRVRLHRSSTAGEKIQPCIAYIAGSAFFGAPLDRPEYIVWFVEHGFSVAQIEHRGSLEGGVFPAALHDVVAAVRYVRGHATEMAIDPTQICAYGLSSGSWFASMLGVSSSEKFQAAGLLGLLGDPKLLSQSSTVKCVVGVFGPTSFTAMDGHSVPINGVPPELHDEPNSPESLFMGFAVQENQEEVARASPLSYVEKSTCPFFLVHGDSDPLVPVGQSRILFEKLKEQGVDVTYEEIPGAGHGTREFGEETLLRKHLAFMGKHTAV